MAATNGARCIGGWNPPLKVVLNLRNGEVMWRRDYVTYNVEFVATRVEWTRSSGKSSIIVVTQRVVDSTLSLGGSGRRSIVTAALRHHIRSICIMTMLWVSQHRLFNCLYYLWNMQASWQNVFIQTLRVTIKNKSFSALAWQGLY